MRGAIARAQQQPGRDLERDPPTILIASHENLIRALVMEVEKLSEQEVWLHRRVAPLHPGVVVGGWKAGG